MSPETWQACFTNPQRGLAAFDGVGFQTDSFEDKMNERVFPILEEEQILMCRLMSSLLKPGSLVLDIGTGSGVLGIWAAAHGCKVVGIDISARAVAMAKDNALFNHVHPVDSWNELYNGSIFFEVTSIEEFAKKDKNRNAYDVILLNPPFNPTCPGLVPAIHAAAGPDGQQAFSSMIKLVPKILKNEGTFVGFHMSTARGGKITALEAIQEVFEERCEVKYARALAVEGCEQKPISCREFLKAVYEKYLQEVPEQKPDRKAVQEYIESFPKEMEFDLIYFEARRTAQKVGTTLINNLARPNIGWKERIRWHKLIVENV